MGKVMGYKCFNKDFTCNNFKFKVGKTFTHEGTIALCKEGFHFCKEIQHVFNYYQFDSNNHVCLVEASGEVVHGDDKSVCSKIKIVKELSWNEVIKLSNLGSNNLGFRNAGNGNAGYGQAVATQAMATQAMTTQAMATQAMTTQAMATQAVATQAVATQAMATQAMTTQAMATQAMTTQAMTTQAMTTQAVATQAIATQAIATQAMTTQAMATQAMTTQACNRNAGNDNAGYGNAGNRNAGNDNAGSSNAGNRNAGYGNAGNDNAGMFNSKPGKLRLFNKETSVKWEDKRIQAAIQYSPNLQEYVYYSSMTDQEKKDFPYAITTGGYYRQLGYKEGWIRFWGNATDSVKKAFLNLPNFDKKVFEEITGVKV
jgi:hypothetical protein